MKKANDEKLMKDEKVSEIKLLQGDAGKTTICPFLKQTFPDMSFVFCSKDFLDVHYHKIFEIFIQINACKIHISS